MRKPWFALLGMTRLGLRARFTIYGALLAAALVVVLTALSYLNMRSEVLRYESHELDSAAQEIGNQLELAIETVDRDIASLSRQSLLANALLDSAGRDTYLRPFLAEHQLSAGFDYNLVLTDFKGEALAARKTLRSYRAAPWFGTLLEQGKPYAAIESEDGRPLLRLAYPVMYGYTGTWEGALVFETDLRAWLEGRKAPFEIARHVAHVEFFAGGKSIALPKDLGVDHALDRVRALRTQNLVLDPGLELHVAIDSQVFNAPLGEHLRRHLLIGLLAIVLVAAGCGALARAQTRRIEDLAAAATRAAQSGQGIRFLSGSFGDDEIGDLAASLAKLLGELAEQQRSLESVVAERTSELALREGDLLRAQKIARIGSWRFEAETGQLHCSAETCSIFGFEPGGGVVAFADYLERVHPDDREWVERVHEHTSAGEPCNIEHRIVVDGTKRWVNMQAEPTTGADGKATGCVGTVQEITERRLAEDKLRRLSAAVEQGSALIVITDAAGEIQYVNPQFEKVTGFSAAEVRGENPRLWKSTRFLRFEYAALWATISNGRVWRGEFENRRKDGTTYWALASISPIFDADGSISGYVAVEEDITQRRAEERRTREREAKLSALIAAMPDLLFVVDKTGVIREFQAPDVRRLQARPENLIDRSYREIFPADLADRFEAVFAAVEHDACPRQIEYVLDGADGRRHFDASVSLVEDEFGAADSYIVVSRDVTERRRVEQALVASEARYRTLFADSAVVLMVVDPESSRIVDANAAAAAYYGYDVATLKGMTVTQINLLDADRVRAEMAAASVQERTHFNFRHRLASGEVRDVEVSSGPIDVGGRKLLLSAVVDVTERLRNEARMREALVVFNASNQGIMTTDADGVITSVNPAFCAITGYAPEAAIGQRPSIFRSDRHDAAFYTALWESLVATGNWEGEIWNRRRSGEIYPQWLTISAVRDDQGKAIEYVALFSDITQRKQQEEAVWRQANFDALTGLANRSLLHDRLERALAQARRNGRKVGLLFLDLDGFKAINDTLGHDVGDQLLIEVARRLRGCVRDQDTVARLGGDEFTLVIHDLADADALQGVAEKAVSVLREPFALGGSQHQLSGSVGVTLFPDDGQDVQTLLRNADIAMYKSKQTGKNRFHFYDRHMQDDAQTRARTEVELRLAIEQRAFVLHYQPIVDADTGELVAAEALIRWQHPERGLIQPNEFMTIAEDCGLAVAIGEWALRELARQSRAWQAEGWPALRLALNVSGAQFRKPELPELIARVLAEHGVEPQSLMLEITESVLIDGSDAAEARMREIKAQGVGCALDDFGTGFSSLSYLKRFPVDIVKIDRSFVRDCPDDRNDAHLVEAIIGMAHSLDLAVTAEGVETEAQIDFLRDLGCDFLQGYLIGMPQAAAEFTAVIQRRQLLPQSDSASLEESRLLAALRQDELDVEEWLRRLLGERSPELASYLEECGWVSHGVDLRQAVDAHLHWRRRLNDYICGRDRGAPLTAEDVASAKHCELGRWIAEVEGASVGRLEDLDRAHREFHRLAGQIVADYSLGYRDSARRALTSLKFRAASRNVVVALIDSFQDDLAKVE